MKLTALAGLTLALVIILACTSSSGGSSAASQRCEDAATYVAAAFATSNIYTASVAHVLAVAELRPGQEGDIAGISSDFANEFTDLLDELGPPEDFIVFHEALTGQGRDIARGLRLISEGHTDDGGNLLLRVFPGEETDVTDLMPDWIWECGIYG